MTADDLTATLAQALDEHADWYPRSVVDDLAPTVAALIEAAEKRGAQRALTEAADALDTIRHDHTAMLDALVRAGVLATMWAAVNEAGGCIVRATRREAENDLARMCNQTLTIDEPPPPAPVGIRRRYVTEWTADA